MKIIIKKFPIPYVKGIREPILNDKKKHKIYPNHIIVINLVILQNMCDILLKNKTDKQTDRPKDRN